MYYYKYWDWKQEKDLITLEVLTAGIPKDKITVHEDNGELIVEKEDKEYLRFSIPSNVDLDNLSAENKDGILTIKLPLKVKKKKLLAIK